MKKLVNIEVKVRDFMDADLQAQLYTDWGYTVSLKVRKLELVCVVATKLVTC